MPRILAPLALAAALLALVPAPALASGVIVGPVSFGAQAASCSNVAAGGVTFGVFQGFQGLIAGNAVSSALVVIQMNPGGYVVCQPQGAGFWAYGDGTGVAIIA